MATKNYRLGSGLDNNFGALFEADQAAASRTDGWTVGTTVATRTSHYDGGTKQLASSFSTTTKPATVQVGTAANGFKTPAALTGIFANSAWTFTFAVRSVTGTAQRGRMKLRVFKGATANGTGATELTGGVAQIGTTLSTISTTVDTNTVVTWSPGATVVLNNEFLFFTAAWEVTTAGITTSADVVIRTGQAAAGSFLVTPDFVPAIVIGKAGSNVSSHDLQTIDSSIQLGCDPVRRAAQGVIAREALLTEVKINLNKVGSQNATGIEVEAYTDNAGVPGTLIATVATIPMASISSGAAIWHTLPCSISVTKGAKIYIVVRPTGDVLGTDTGSCPYISTVNGNVGSDGDWGYWNGSSWTWGGGTSLSAKITFTLSTTVVRGITFSEQISSTPLAIGKRATATIVRGVIVSGIGAVPAVIGHIPVGLPYAAQILADGSTGYWRMDDAGLPQDSSPSGNHMQSEAGSTVAQVPGLLVTEPTSKARSFQASFVYCGGILYPLNTFSIEFWVKRNVPTASEIIFDQYNGGIQACILGDGTINLSRSYVGACATTSVLKITDTNTHHVVITRNGIGGAIVFYLDGISETPTPSDPNQDFSTPATNGVFIGSEWGNNPLDGTLDEVAIYPSVLSATKVAAHYKTGTVMPGTSVVRGVTLAQAGYPISVGKRVSATAVRGIAIVPISTTYYGSTSLTISFNATTAASRKTFGTIAVPVTFGATTQARRKTFGTVAVPVAFSATTQAKRKTFGVVALPISFSATTSGIRIAGSQTYYGSAAMAISFGAVTQARRKTFGIVAMPTTFGAVVQGRRKTFSSVSAPFTVAITVQGRRVAMGVVSMPITVTISTAGYSLSPYTVINKADRVYVGANQASRVYAGTTKVWGP